MNKLRLLASVIFISIMTMMWLSLDDKTPPPIQSNLNTAERPAYVAVDLNRIVYDQDGNQTQQLSAKKMTYFESQNRAEFESPLLVLGSEQQNAAKTSNGNRENSKDPNKDKSKNNNQWKISSDSGILYNNERLFLHQNVNAINLIESDYINSILTDSIEVNIKQNILLSDDIVQINGDGVIMIGSGLIANLNDQQIELIKHAKTTYQTQKNDK